LSLSRSWVIFTRERWAWHWARRNAPEWAALMQRRAEWCLANYELRPQARGFVGYEMRREGAHWTFANRAN
jgi:hypothetical protein